MSRRHGASSEAAETPKELNDAYGEAESVRAYSKQRLAKRRGRIEALLRGEDPPQEDDTTGVHEIPAPRASARPSVH